MDCQICCYKYTSKLRRKYTCFKCANSACIRCVFKYMLENIGNIRCMFCEESFLITDMRYCLSTAKYNLIASKELSYLFQNELSLLKATTNMMHEEQQIMEMDIMTQWMRKDGMTDDQISFILENMGYKRKKYRHVNHNCPRCNIPIQNYTCEECMILICSECIHEKTINHECNQEVLETYKYIYTNCTACPKCFTLIEKETGGCDQMFCVKCKTTFSWATRKIIPKGEVLHNPHFYEWQRSQNIEDRNPLDNPCEGHFLIKCQTNLDSIKLDTFSESSLSVNKGLYLKYVQGILLRSVEVIIGIQERDDFVRQQFRIRYLTKILKFKQWKKRFNEHINTIRRNNEIKIFLMTCLDCLYYIVLFKEANTQMLENLFIFITTSLRHIQNMYGRKFNYRIDQENIILPYML